MQDETTHYRALPSQQRAIQTKAVHPTGHCSTFTYTDTEQSIPSRFEQQVARYPNRLALQAGMQALTYTTLNGTANRIAHTILAQSGKRHEATALLLGNDPSIIAGLLGVLKAGQAYVPLDPLYPPSQLAAILASIECRMLITNTQLFPLAQSLAPATCCILNVDRLDMAASEANPNLESSPDAMALILYTSGSTGQPKGVVQNHRNVLHQIMSYTNSYHICADDRLTLLHACSFSASLGNLFGALLNGATLCLFDLRTSGMEQFIPWLTQEAVTIVHMVPAVFRQMRDFLSAQATFPEARLMILSGEAVTAREVALYQQHFAPHCVLVQRFSTTETNAFCQYFLDQATPFSGPTVPAGYPADDKDVLLLDEAGAEVGLGDIGEIVVKSRYLALGYWRQPELTRASFRPDPQEGYLRRYHTGDLGRRLPDGCIEFCERQDFQVKIRGQRVDTVMVEQTLVEHPAVKDTVVMRQETPAGDPQLVAYIVPTQDSALAISTLRRFLQQTLPDVMIPSIFVPLEALPLNPNGKVDRRALPVPERTRAALATEFVAPRTPIEATLVTIWADMLGLDQVGIDDPFLELGGHSLIASRIIARVIETFHVSVPIQTLLESPTVADMAVAILQSQVERIAPEEQEHLLSEAEGLDGA